LIGAYILLDHSVGWTNQLLITRLFVKKIFSVKVTSKRNHHEVNDRLFLQRSTMLVCLRDGIKNTQIATATIVHRTN